jgi:hypothetical protein
MVKTNVRLFYNNYYDNEQKDFLKEGQLEKPARSNVKPCKSKFQLLNTKVRTTI